MRKRLAASIGILGLFLLAGCGGGGSDSASLTYTGSTSQASIVDNNAEEIGIAAYQAGERSSNLTGPLGSSPELAAAGSPRVVTLVRTLQSLADKMVPEASNPVRSRSTLAPKELVTITETGYDDFGGSVTLSITADNVTGVFNGSFTFQNFHPDNNTVLSGGAAISGIVDVESGGLVEIQFAFSSLSLTDTTGSVTVAGTIELVTSPTSATINLVFRDNVTGKTVWIDNYTMNIVEGPDVSPVDGTADYIEVTVSGRIYLHDYGYVDITTPSPLVINAEDLNPSSGTLLVTGGAGRSVRLVVVDATGFDLEADLEPDGVYEWTSPGHLWE